MVYFGGISRLYVKFRILKMFHQELTNSADFCRVIHPVSVECICVTLTCDFNTLIRIFNDVSVCRLILSSPFK